jgi:serine/threonine-protein kinase
VLYFDDLSTGDTLGFVTDGLTEGLIEKLSGVRGLDVVSRNGVAPYRGRNVPRDSVARALEVGSLIAGSIEPVGDRLRVTARLVDGASGADIDRASFELSTRDLLAAQDSVIESVSRFLRQRLGEEIRVRERRGETASVEAWGYVQRAERLRKDAEDLTDKADTTGAVRLLQQADSILVGAEAADRNWVEPSILRGWLTYDRSRLARGLEGAPMLEQALANANRALEREARNPEALALRGTVRYRQFQLEVTPDPVELDSLLFGAKADLEAAVETDPGLADAHIILSRLYYEPGIRDVPSALLAARRGYEADAYLDRANALLNRLFWGHIDLEQFSQARRWCAEGARRFPAQPAFLSCQLWLMATPAVPADVDQAWRLLARFDSLTPGAGPTFNGLENLMLVGGALGRAGLVDSARSVLLRARGTATSEIDPHQDLVPVEAYVRSLFGDHDEAIDLLKAYVAANPEHNFPAQAGTAWWWRDLRGHPRFVEITGG